MAKLHTLSALEDNYIYLVDIGEGAYVAIDPGESAPVMRWLDTHGGRLEAIWCTHHHPDHVGGISVLKKKYATVVVASEVDGKKIAGCDRFLKEGEPFEVRGLAVQTISVPGHTMGAISYYVPEISAAFTGDTLFNAGCGRLFEGTPELMWKSLACLAALPDDTRVFGGHEYTESNLGFALEVEPENADVRARFREVVAAREQGRSTVGATMALEKATNPFLRVEEPSLVQKLELVGAGPVAVFAALRRQKDSFRYTRPSST